MQQASVAAPLRLVLDWGARYHLHVFNLGLACCAVEFVAASVACPELVRRRAAPGPAAPRDAHVLVVSGTVTDKMAPLVRRLYEQVPEPRYVLSFGACSNSGGPYWDSYCVVQGVDQLIPVDMYVPGCPPRPQALMQALLLLQERVWGPAPEAAAVTGSAPSTRVAGPQDLRRPLP